MRIAQTRIRNFRNLENALCEWHPGLNVLSGPNGAGKTNVLEALHVITGWGAFSGSRCSDTVRWNSEGGASLAAQAEGERSALIEAHIVARASLRVDGKACRWGDLRSCVQSLAFLPADMALIEGSPAVRRRFLDVLCALVFPLYETMAALAVWIWECRTEVTSALEKCLEKWNDLLPRPVALELKRGGAGNADDLLEDFHRSCAILAERERASGTPLVGPHRDDLLLSCESRTAAEVLSRGQRRRAALSLIMAAASAVQERYRAAPVLLLDEVTSELDASGRDILMNCLGRSGWQVFAATAESPLPQFDGAAWKLDAGKIERISS